MSAVELALPCPREELARLAALGKLDCFGTESKYHFPALYRSYVLDDGLDIEAKPRPVYKFSALYLAV